MTGAVPLPGTDIAVVIRDGSGRFSRLSVGTASQGSANVDVDLARAAGGRTIAPGPGLRLVGLELSFPAPGGLFVSGRVEVTHVLMSARSSGDSWTELPVAPGSSGWAWQRIESPSAARGTGTLSYTPPADGWGRIVLGSNIGSTSADVEKVKTAAQTVLDNLNA